MRTVIALLMAAALAPTATPQTVRNYEYDALGRLKKVDTQASKVEYTYDPADNRTVVTAAPHIINGTSGDDTLLGTYRTEQINGLSGNDFLGSGGGSDDISGGAGWDTIFYGTKTDYTFVRASSTLVNATHSPTGALDKLTAVENACFLASMECFPIAYLLTPTATVNGTSGNDVLNGGMGDERINGLAGNDYIAGGGGADTIDGGDGTDVEFLYGAPADYSFVWVTIGTTANAGLHATHTSSGAIELLINMEGAYFVGTAQYIAIEDLVP